jgi:hypothetical protein
MKPVGDTVEGEGRRLRAPDRRYEKRTVATRERQSQILCIRYMKMFSIIYGRKRTSWVFEVKCTDIIHCICSDMQVASFGARSPTHSSGTLI